MDGMGRAALLRSGGWGYGALLAAMSAWAPYGCARAAMSGVGPGPVPGLLLLSGVLAQGVSRLAIGRRLASGGEGAGGPGRLIAVVLGAVAVTAALVAAGVPLSSGARPA
jgi:hypothetical protein